MKSKIKYKRVLLKVSGEGFGDKSGRGVETERFDTLAKEIKKVSGSGVELAVVVGGGNILRGAKFSGTSKSRVQADQVGMIATVVNALLLQDTLEGFGVETRVVSAIEIKNITEPFVFRAIEINADVMLKATQVDGVYTDDPLKNTSAKLYRKLTYMDVLSKRLGVMDLTAISLSMENKLPIVVFNINKRENIGMVISGKPVGTYIGE